MPITFRTPTLADIVRKAMERRLMDIYVGMPGQIVTYDPATQTATVQPLLRKLDPDPTGADRVSSLPTLQRVPIVQMGSGSWRITTPVSAGDQVWICWSDRSLDRWKSLSPSQYNPDRATGTNSIDPQANNLHSLSDAVAFLGLVPPSAARAAPALDRISIGSDSGAVIEVLSSRINLGAGATQALVLGGNYQSHMTQLSTALNSLSIALNTVASAITPLMLPPAAAAAAAGMVLAVTAASAAVSAATSLASDISTKSFTT